MQLVILSNRKHAYLPETLRLIREHVTGWDSMIIVDDSGDQGFREWLADQARDATIVPVAESAAGYTEAMNTVTGLMRGQCVAFWEEDFHPICDIDLAQIAEELKSRPHLAQLALLRQPWFANEIRHGGVLEALEADGAMFTMNDGVIEHTSFFTGNPSVWSEAAYKTGWPSGSWTENKKRDELRIQGFAFGMLPEVRVHHVGQRTGFGY